MQTDTMSIEKKLDDLIYRHFNVSPGTPRWAEFDGFRKELIAALQPQPLAKISPIEE